MIAVVIPYYKLTFFKETLQSLAAQTDKRFHVYIGNDASPEDPENLLKNYEGLLNFTYKRFSENLGGTSLTQQWDRCIEMINDEEWLMILGDDDVLGNTVVEKFYAHYDEFNSKSNVVRFASQVIDEFSNILKRRFSHESYEDAVDIFYRKCRGLTRGSLSEYFFRSDQVRLKKIRNYPLAWCADDMAIIDVSEDKKVYTINSSTVFVRFSKINITGSDKYNNQKELASSEMVFDLIKEYNKRLSSIQLSYFIKSLEYYYFRLEAPSKKYLRLLFINHLKNDGFKENMNFYKTLFVSKFLSKGKKIVLMKFMNKFVNLPPIVCSIDNTITHIISKKSSVSRFGDGELWCMVGGSIPFQSGSKNLSKKLKEVLRSDIPNHLVCIPNIFDDKSLSLRTEENQIFWRNHLEKHRADWYRFLKSDKIYGNTAISRFYIPMKDKINSWHSAELLKKIWVNQNLLIIEGEKSRLGIGNDLFAEAQSIQRILCPPENAFAKYDLIYNAAQKYGSDRLILIALGPTATILSYDLHRVGFWAIDIGHVDLEYEWMKMGVEKQVKVDNKYVNEVEGDNIDNLNTNLEERYNSEIVEKIL